MKKTSHFWLLLSVCVACSDTPASGPDAVDTSDVPDITPADITPADITPADITPADITPADVTPADVTPADVTPADITPADITDTADSFDVPAILTVAIVADPPAATVPPQTVLSLSIDSDLPEGHTARWTVTQPDGSVSVFMPSASALAPAFELNVAGIYEFTLEILDPAGHVAASATHTVSVVPTSALHVSLTWRTPDDPDESDIGYGRGSDIDLHLLRTDRGGTWFDPDHDTFWMSPGTPSVSDPPVADQPSLDRDDTDGGGPENINVAAFGDATYAVAVHYFDDHDFGLVYATLRVWVNGTLVETWADIALTENDFWHAFDIDKDGHVSRVGTGEPDITPNITVPGGPTGP